MIGSLQTSRTFGLVAQEMAYIPTALGLLFSTIILYGCARLFVNRRPPNFPPCPPTVPILGNLHQLPLQKQYACIAELWRKYSSHGLMGLQLGPSTHVVVINSWKVARDLLDRRGAVYSSRPSFLIASLVLPVRLPELFIPRFSKYLTSVYHIPSIFSKNPPDIDQVLLYVVFSNT